MRTLLYGRLFNDLYSRDCSVKVKNGKRTTALQGKYQNPWAPFGYVKSAQERGKLEIDPAAAEIVRHIFALFLEGRGTVEVARILNRDGVPTKSEYRAAQGDKMRWQHVGDKVSWNAAAVRGILTDKRYIGSVVYGRQQAKGVAAHRNIKAPQEKLVEVENCHEPLVSQEDFEQAQALLGSGIHHAKSNRPLAGKIKCGVCGHAMPLRKGKEPYFTCGTKWYDSDYSCGDMQYPQEALFSVLKQALEQQIALRVEQKALQKVKMEENAQKRVLLERQAAGLELKIMCEKEKLRIQFEHFANGTQNSEAFSVFQAQCKWQIAQQTKEISTIRQQIAELDEMGENFGYIVLTREGKNAIITFNGIEITSEIFDMFIQGVRLYPDKSIGIDWNFDSV